MFDLAVLTPLQICFSLAVGVALGLAYLIILYKTLLYLPKVQKKGNFLFISAVIRIFLVIFVALYFSYDNGARFLLIFIGFIITRIIVLKYIKNNVLNTINSRVSASKALKSLDTNKTPKTPSPIDKTDKTAVKRYSDRTSVGGKPSRNTTAAKTATSKRKPK